MVRLACPSSQFRDCFDVLGDRASIEVDTTNYQRPAVNVEIMIDGKPAYQCVLVFSRGR